MLCKTTNYALCSLLLAAALLAGCSGEDPPPRPNIVIYLVDTLRQDHLGLYGYERETSPSIDALAEDSIVFKQAYATSAWTKASTGSLLTGLHPRQHGATSRSSPLSPQAKLLSEYLSPIGYFCAGIVTNPFVVEHWGFNRGYEVFEDLGEQAP
jgi:arylsulfatase A-like enzyme